jgi:citrate lyase beta subunit
MSPEYLRKWEHILEDVEKSRVPVQFIKKIVVKMTGKKQHTINIQTLLKQGLDPEEIEEVVSRKLNELDPLITSFEFVLNVESIAETVQPETDRLLGNL